MDFRVTETTAACHGERLYAFEARCVGNDSPSGMGRATESRGSIQGQFLRLGTHREVALYLREGSAWIAEFVDGQGALIDVDTWLRFNCGTPVNAHAARRTAIELAIPLSLEIAARIERLHQAAVAGRKRLHFIESSSPLVPVHPLPFHCAATAFATKEQETCFGMFSIPLQD